MTERVDCVVIGAGVVGLAVARGLAMAGREVVILEAAPAIGTGTSSRNSEVIHAGMYYPKGSLKARLCVSGNALLRRYLAEHGVAHRMVGKLIVATNEAEDRQLDAILEKGLVNGVEGLVRIGADQAREMEPALNCRGALHSPATGILDTHGYMLALLGDVQDRGGALALKSPVIGGEVTAKGVELSVGGSEPMRLLTRSVVNSAGLGAQAVATSLAGLPAESIPPLRLCKGNYFLLNGRTPFSRLVYPIPSSAGLGVHFTLDLAGQGRFGPDVEWASTENYDVDACRGDGFYASIRRYWPDLAEGALRPGYAGMRPKIHGPGEPAADFLIQGPSSHGVTGLVNLYGIESPGLTSSLAIAEYIAERLG